MSLLWKFSEKISNLSILAGRLHTVKYHSMLVVEVGLVFKAVKL